MTLKHLLAIAVYFAICCLNWITENLLVGWLFVIATTLWMMMAGLYAFRNGNRFSLGFSVFGFAWLAIILGISIQTPLNSKALDLRIVRSRIYSLAKSIGPSRTLPTSTTLTTYGELHDLTDSGPMGMYGSPPIPHFYNTMRLAVCLSSLIAGSLGGLLLSFLRWPKLEYRDNNWMCTKPPATRVLKQ